jgi:sugar fermentation stimulation protein A
MSTVQITLPENCVKAVFESREKRFIINARINGNPVAAHTNNSGSMLGLLRPGKEILLSRSDSPKRKLAYTLELIRHDGFWVGVNTLIPNRMLKLAWQERLIPELDGYESFRSETAIGQSRIDACLEGPRGKMWIEAKNVTLVEDDRACFPDAVSNRAARHMREMMILSSAGHKVSCFCLVQRPDCRCFGPADFIDPLFTRLFRLAADNGMEILAYGTIIQETGIRLGQRLPVFWG